MRKLIIAIIIFWVLPVFAANVCVGPSATGDESGDDWNNIKAISTLTGSNWVRDNTYYLMEGDYGQITLTTPIDSTKYVYIKKCADTTCQAITGYSSSDHDGTANFSSSDGDPIQIGTAYWDIDGITGGGPGSWDSGHGIVFSTTDETNVAVIRIQDQGSGTYLPHHIKILHCELYGPCTTDNATASNNYGMIAFMGRTDNTVTWDVGGNEFRCLYMHNSCASYVFGYHPGETLVEYNLWDQNLHFRHTYTDESVVQGNEWVVYGTKDLTFRYNLIGNTEGNSLFSFYGGHGVVTEPGGSVALHPTDNVKIYGNVFFRDEYSLPNDKDGLLVCLAKLDGCGAGDGYGGYSPPCDGSVMQISDVYFYNNTLINLPLGSWWDLTDGTDYDFENLKSANNLYLFSSSPTTSNAPFNDMDHAYDGFYGVISKYESSSLGYNSTETLHIGAFEGFTGDDADHWTEVNCDTAEDDSFVWSGSSAYETAIANDCVKVTTSAANGYIYYDYTVTASTKYKLTLHYKNTAGDEARLWLYDVTNSAWITSSDGVALDSNTDWQMWVYEVETPADCTTMRVEVGATGNGDVVWYDFVEIKPYTDSTWATVEDYEQIFSANPVTDWKNRDFSLVAATEAGDSTIGITYNTDMLGNTRGADGVWDRGALEYGVVPSISGTSF
jgi:hypothetical protein